MVVIINRFPYLLSLDDFFLYPGHLLYWRRRYLFNSWLYISFVISYVVILVCYWKVFRAVKEHNVTLAPSLNRASHNTQVRNHSDEVSGTMAIASIVFVFTICWIASEVMDTIDKINFKTILRDRFVLQRNAFKISSMF